MIEEISEYSDGDSNYNPTFNNRNNTKNTAYAALVKLIKFRSYQKRLERGFTKFSRTVSDLSGSNK